MCWNQTISLNTFLFSLFGASFAYLNKVINIYYYLFFLSFSSMQLVEYFAWGNLNNKKRNRFLSQIGLILIAIQPILFTLSIANLKYNIKASLIALYCIIAVFCYITIPVDFSMVKASNGHLAWNWLKPPKIYIFLWVSIMLGLLLYAQKYFEFTVLGLLFIAIYYTYYKTNTWGSLWCWIANIVTIKLIIQTFLHPALPNCLLFEKK